MYDNQFQNLVDPTLDLKTIGCKRIFKKKIDMDENVQTFKARLGVKGYTQGLIMRKISHWWLRLNLLGYCFP